MKLNKFILISIFLLFFLLYSFSFNQFQNKIFYSPDENINMHMSTIYSNSGKFYYKESLNNNLDNKIVHPRGIIPRGEKLVSILPIGGQMLWGTLMMFGMNHLISFFVPLASILTLLFLFLLLNKLFNKKIAYFSCLIVAIMAPFWFFSSSIMVSDILFLFFATTATFFLFKSKLQENNSIFLSSFFFSMSLLINYRAIFFLFSFLISFVFYFGKNIFKNKGVKKLLIILFGALIVLATLLFLNYILYGNPFSTGYSAIEKYSQEIEGPKFSLFYLEIPKLFFNLSNYLFYIPLYMAILTFGIFSFVLNKKNTMKKTFLFSFILYFAIATLYLSNIASAGTDTFSIQSSFFRYILPIFLLGGPFIYASLKNIKKYNKLLFVFLFVLINVGIIVASNGGITYYKNYETNSLNYINLVINNTEKDSVIVTSYYDKVLFPKRNVADITLITEKGSLVGKEIDEKVVADTIVKISKPVYILNRGGINLNCLREELNLKGFEIIEIKNVPHLYKILAKNEN